MSLDGVLRWILPTKPCGCFGFSATAFSEQVGTITDVVTQDHGAAVEDVYYEAYLYRCKQCGDEYERRERYLRSEVRWKNDDSDHVDADSAGSTMECRAVADDDSAATADDRGGQG